MSPLLLQLYKFAFISWNITLILQLIELNAYNNDILKFHKRGLGRIKCMQTLSLSYRGRAVFERSLTQIYQSQKKKNYRYKIATKKKSSNRSTN